MYFRHYSREPTKKKLTNRPRKKEGRKGSVGRKEGKEGHDRNESERAAGHRDRREAERERERERERVRAVGKASNTSWQIEAGEKRERGSLHWCERVSERGLPSNKRGSRDVPPLLTSSSVAEYKLKLRGRITIRA